MASPYESLEPGQTRILCLYPGEPGTPLHGHLEILQLDNMSSAKPYSAISYAWASHVLQYNIQLPDGTLLPITAALHGALQRFRHPSAEIRIWADAVCISQTDMEEKSAQILVIKDVFAQAHQILIWLGESAKSDSLVFMQLYRIRAGITRFNKGAELNEVIIANRSECYCCAEPVPVNTEEDNDIDPYSSGPVTRAALQDLLSRPWFTRLWVAQEVTAAVTSQIIILHSGSHQIPWQSFADLTRHCLNTYYSNLPRMSARRFPDMFEVRGGLRDVNKMLSFSRLDCTMPHDRVYAVRHLLNSDAIMALVPDYSLPIQKLFSAATAILLQAHPKDKSDLSPITARNSIDESEHAAVLLAIARLSKDSHDAAWPTWAPDYHNMKSEIERFSLQYNRKNYRPNFNANNSRIHVGPSIEAWSKIDIKGQSFGTIAAVLQTSVLPRMPSHLDKDAACIINYGLELLRWYEECRVFVRDNIGSDVRPSFKRLFNCGRWGTYDKDTDSDNRAKESPIDEFPFRSGPKWGGWFKILPLPLETFKLDASVLQGHFGIVIPSDLISPPSGKIRERTGLKWPSIVLLPRSWFDHFPAPDDVRCHVVRNKEELPTDVFNAIVDLQSALGPIWRWESEPRMEERRVLCSFRCARGIRFGWVPPDSCQDDELCQFAGAPFPFVIRRVDRSNARMLVGDAWVYDISGWETRVPDSKRHEIVASVWPHLASLSRDSMHLLERQVARDHETMKRVLDMVEEWEEANMGYITLQ